MALLQSLRTNLHRSQISREGILRTNTQQQKKKKLHKSSSNVPINIFPPFHLNYWQRNVPIRRIKSCTETIFTHTFASYPNLQREGFYARLHTTKAAYKRTSDVLIVQLVEQKGGKKNNEFKLIAGYVAY